MPLDFSGRRRRKRNQGGWRRLATGEWQFRVRGIRPNGAPFTVTRTCSEDNRERVQTECRALAEEYRAGLAVPVDRLKLRQLQKQCVRSGLAWTPQEESKWKLLKPLWDYGVEGIDCRVIQRWVAKTLYNGPGRPPKGKASPGYLRHAFGVLRKIVKRGIALRLIVATPWGEETPPSIPKYTQAHKKRLPIALSEIERILEASRRISDSVYLRVLLSLETGSRPMELCRARRDWLKTAGDVLGAPVMPGAGVLSMPACKGGYPHHVPISADVYAEYLRWWDGLPEEAQKSGWLCPIQKSGQWDRPVEWITGSTWAHIIQLAGLSGHGLVLYQLRHTRLAQLSERCGPRVAQAIAGHTSVITTERYAGVAKGLVAGAFAPAAPAASPGSPETASVPLVDTGTGESGNSAGAKKKHVPDVPAEPTIAELMAEIRELKNAMFPGLKPPVATRPHDAQPEVVNLRPFRKRHGQN